MTTNAAAGPGLTGSLPGAAAAPSLARLAARALSAARSTESRLWRDRAALHLLDWLGCAARGRLTPAGQAFERWLALQGTGSAPTLAGRAADASAAACFHGALGSPLEMDDVHRSSILHPGPVVIPAVLAACPASATGPQLLSALLAGYEVAVRVGRALGPSHYRLWHSTATAGHFAAAAGAAVAMGLDEAATAQAMALAGTKAGGLWQVRHESQLGKFWHMAGAARDGLACAQLAASGLTGPLSVIDGPSGWLAASAPEGSVRALDEERDEPWMADVSFKPWPACRHAHPALDALRLALGGLSLGADAIAQIDVRSYADALRFCDRPLPADEGQARFSIQHALAAWIVLGEPQLAHYAPAAIADPRIARLRPRITLAVDEALERRYPAHYGAAVRVRLYDGSPLEAAVADTYGDPARPMPRAAVEDKARMLMGDAGWSGARIERALAACAALPEARDLAALHQVIIGA